ncbi:MAG: YceD family protein [Candidatus Limnocylindria bacterium]
MIAVNVAGLLRERSGASRDVRLRDHYVSLGPDLELAGPLNGTIRLQRTNRGILARGRVSASLRRTCARCLEPYVEEVSVAVDEEFLPAVDAPGSTGLADQAGPDALRIDERNEIDLAPPIHDELALTEPMHPLCRPDCPGLCPVCGERLTSGAHDHGEDEIDPRLADLARLLDRSDG